ncbi:MAG: serine hydrolase [Gammaproteobacteria bacterium]|nr:serine hydrolase [Gammaproteobacteria bacterium]
MKTFFPPHLIIRALMLMVLGQPLCMLAQENSLEATIDEVLAAWNQDQVPGAAVAYLENGNVLFSKAYGLANLEHEIVWTTDTVSDLGSVSKQFTGMAIALLAEQGKLSLDDDIRQYLTELPDLGKTITIRHLFHHTSGLREIYETLFMINRRPGDIILQEDAQTLIQYQSNLQFEPGSRYLYNNTEYMLLADIVEAVTGQQFHDWMDKNIFTPLEMNDTVIMHRQGQVIPRVATSYVKDATGYYNQRYDNSTLQGGGGIYSTVEDMIKWLANFSRHLVGNEQTFKTLTESGVLNNGESLNYGLGISVDAPGGITRWSHSGSSAGYRSMLEYLPDLDRGYIYLTSTPSNGSPASKLSQAFLGDVLPPPESDITPEIPQIPKAMPLAKPKSYAGRYFSDELEVFYTVKLTANELSLYHRWLGEHKMLYLGEDRFFLLELGGTLAFGRNDQNQVDGFLFDNGRTIGVEFRQID